MKFVIIFWGLLIAIGFWKIAQYEQTPGKQLRAPNTSLQFAGKQCLSLVVFIHPQCECSSATLSELERIQAQLSDRLDITVDVPIPHGLDSWKSAPNVLRAQSNKQWHVKLDTDGRFAASMGAQTSGFCILFDAKGTKIFQGGITPSRAHEGDNVGQDAIVHYVRTGAIETSSTPVYGCALGTLGASWK